MIQQIIIALIFIGATWYLGRMVFRSFQSKNDCGADCKCEVASNAKVPKAKSN